MRSPADARAKAARIDWPGRTTSVRAEAGKPASSRPRAMKERMFFPVARRTVPRQPALASRRASSRMDAGLNLLRPRWMMCPAAQAVLDDLERRTARERVRARRTGNARGAQERRQRG